MKRRIFALSMAVIMILLAVMPVIVMNIGGEAHKTIFALNTVIDIRAYGKNAENALSAIQRRVTEIDRDFNAYNERSYVSKINENAYNEPVSVSDDVFYVLKTALEISEKSDGAFDITVKPLIDLWDINKRAENDRYDLLTDKADIDIRYELPTEDEIKDALSGVGYKNVVLDEDNKTVSFLNKDTKIDLGAIAKGYAGDEVRRIFGEYGVKRAYADLGGNEVLIGDKGGLFNKDWKIGIKTPFGKSGEYFAVVKDKDTSLVTSGPYERYFEQDGAIYHHIIDPKTGAPCESDLQSVTVISKNSTLADALSTAVFVLGKDKGLELVNSISEAEAICTVVSGKIFTSDNFSPEDIQIVDDKFSY